MHGFDEIVNDRFLYLAGFLAITFPILGVLTTALPTGLDLYNNGNRDVDPKSDNKLHPKKWTLS